MNNQMELSFSAAAQNEAFARMVISAFLVRVNPKLSDVSEIRTAVSEAVTNSIVHAYSGDEGKVVMRARLDDTYVYIEIEHYGKGIGDIRQAMQPFFTTQPEQERTGMGFALMQSFMDEVHVSSAVGSGKLVCMKKRLNECDDDI